jgi:hypothetical protein
MSTFPDDEEFMCVFDNGSSVVSFCSPLLFLDGSIKPCSPIPIRNSTGTYSRIRYKGCVPGFDNHHVYYDQDQFINILCQHFIFSNPKLFKVEEMRSSRGFLYGYDVCLIQINVTVNFRWYRKIMIGSLRPIYEYMQQQFSYAMSNAKAHAVLKDMSKRERAVNSVRRVQRSLGFLSDEYARLSISKFVDGCSVHPEDFKRASDGFGRDIPMSKAKDTQRHKLPVHNYWKNLKAGQVAAEMDIAWVGQFGFLVSVAVELSPENLPVLHYVSSVFLGLKSHGCTSSGSLKHGIIQIKSMLSRHRRQLVNVVFDSESSVAKAATGVINDIQLSLHQENDILVETLPSGVHAKKVERRIRVWNDKVNSIVFTLPYSVPVSWIQSLGTAAVNYINLSPSKSNPGMTPPYVMLTGNKINFKNQCVASFGSLVLVTPTYGVIEKLEEHRHVGIYLYPNNENGSHKVLLLDSLEGRKMKVDRMVLVNDVLPQFPLYIIARINAQAKVEMKVHRQKRLLSDEEIEDLEVFTGYKEDRMVLPGSSVLSRDSRTTAIVSPESRDVAESVLTTEECYVQPPISVPSFSSYLYALVADIVPESIEAADVDYMYAVKKELRYNKAVKEFGKESTDGSLAKELLGLVKKKVWRLVIQRNLTKSQRKAILPSSALFRMKNASGSPLIKCRIVGLGNLQDTSIYDFYKEISSPTAFLSSMLAVISNAAAKGKKAMSLDVGQAFLNAKMTGHLVHVRLDKISAQLLMQIDNAVDYTPFLNDDGTIVVQLDKALYGCVESARLWYNHLKDLLVSFGFSVSPLDECIFNYADESGVITATAVFHVDDGLIVADTEEFLTALAEKFLKAFDDDVKIHRGSVHDFLGMKIDFSVSKQVEITMEKYIKDMISTFEVSKVRNVPARADLFDVDESIPLLDEERSKALHRGICQALYLATHVRPDILCSIIFLTSRVHALNESDWQKFIRVLEYLNGTSHLGIILGADESGKVKLHCYADASFGVHVDGKSHGGVYVSYGRGPIMVASHKHKIVSKSSSEAELVTLSDGTSMFVRELEFARSQQYIDSDEPGVIHEDNKSTIHMANSGKSMSNRTRHIKIRYFFIKQFLDNGSFILQHCPTEHMIADLLTKPLQGQVFCMLRDIMLGYAMAIRGV